MDVLNKIVFLTLSSLSLASSGEINSSDSCRNPEACIEELISVEYDEGSSHRYPSLAQQEIIDQLMELGDQVTPLLVELLTHENEQVTTLAGRILRDVKSIDAKFLPKITEAIENGTEWLPPALASIGTPEAAESAVQFFLASKSSPNNQEGYALRLLGKKAIPSIISAAQCKYTCEENTHYLLG